MPSHKNRLDGGLRYLQRRGMARGVRGDSRTWLYVFVAAFAIRRFRRAIGSEYETVWRGEIRPGETIRIGHLTERYDGTSVKSRRRRVRRSDEG